MACIKEHFSSPPSGSPEAIGVHALERVGVVGELDGELRLGGAAAWDEEPLLHQAPDDAQGVVKGAVGFL